MLEADNLETPVQSVVAPVTHDAAAEIVHPVMPITLTRLHYKRLRWYFRSARGAGGHGDNIDLDLAAAGLIKRHETYGGYLCFVITQPGICELSAENKREIERRSPHHDLSSRLAEWLRQKEERMTWENIEFMTRWRDETDFVHTKACRPDVFSVMKTRVEARIAPQVHEVKISRADFLADIKDPLKRRAYQVIAEKVFYVAPAGIIKPSEIPDGFGLIVEKEEGEFVTLVRPRKKKINFTVEMLMNLVLKPGSEAHA